MLESQIAQATPNDPKLSDGRVRRGTCMAGGKVAAEAGAVTHGAVRCSAWLAVAVILEWFVVNEVVLDKCKTRRKHIGVL